jgi:hypothetical protein
MDRGRDIGNKMKNYKKFKFFSLTVNIVPQNFYPQNSSTMKESKFG